MMMRVVIVIKLKNRIRKKQKQNHLKIMELVMINQTRIKLHNIKNIKKMTKNHQGKSLKKDPSINLLKNIPQVKEIQQQINQTGKKVFHQKRKNQKLKQPKQTNLIKVKNQNRIKTDNHLNKKIQNQTLIQSMNRRKHQKNQKKNQTRIRSSTQREVRKLVTHPMLHLFHINNQKIGVHQECLDLTTKNQTKKRLSL